MAFFQEQRGQHEPFLRAPASVVGLVALLVLIHAARALAPPALSDQIFQQFALDPVVYSPSALHALGAERPSLIWLVLPLFSSIFLHVSWFHVTLNGLWLFAFGPVVARRFGAPAFFAFFLLCGLGGSLVFIALAWGQNIGAIGASGAISGLMGAAFRMIRFREPWLNGTTLPLQPVLSRPLINVTVLWLVLNVVTGLIGPGLIGGTGVIAWQDHMGGYLAGLLLAGPFDHFFGLGARLRGRGP